MVDLLAQQRRQALEVALALVGLDDGAHRHRVLRIGAQDLLVDLDGARRVPQLLAVELRHAPQHLGALPRIGLRRGLAFEQGRQPVPALALEQQPALRLARPRVRRRDLLGPLPRRDRALGIAEALLADRRDLLQPRQQLVGRDPRQPRPLERELEQVGQRRPVALLAEVVGVGGQRDLVLGLDLQHGVQVDGRLIAVAQPVAIQRGQLQHRARARRRVRDRAQLPLAQLGELRVLLAGRVELDQLLRRRSPRRLQQRDLVVDPLRLRQVVQLAFRQLRPLVEEVDPLGLGRRRRDALAVVTIQFLESVRVVVHALQQLRRFGVRGHRLQRAPQGGDRIFGVARFVPAPRHLVVDRRGAVGAVGADPVRVRVDAGQQLQRLLVARAQAHHLGQPLRGRVQLLELLAQHAPEPQQQVGAAAGVGGPFELELVEADDGPVVAQRPVDLARRFDRPDVLLRQLARPLRVADDAFQAREMIQEELAHLAFQLGQPGWIARARDRRGLHLQHRHVVRGPALLAVDVLQASGGPDVGRVAIDGVDEIGFGALAIAELVQPQLRGQVEQLARLGVVFYRLGARFVERDQAIVLLGLTIGLTQRDERFGVCRVPFHRGFVFADGGHAMWPLPDGGRDRPTAES